MQGKKRLFLIIISILLLAAMLFAVAACTKRPGGDEDDDPSGGDVVTKTLTAGEALDKIHTGLVMGKGEMDGTSSYGVSNVFTLYVQGILNYTVTYKANYNENSADSEIYVSFFDNREHIERLTVFYDAGDLYADFTDKKYVISSFGNTMMFASFFDFCKKIDMTSKFYDDRYVATIFDRNNNSVNLGLVLDQNKVNYSRSGETGEVIELSGLNLTIINDTLSYFMDRTFKGIGTKFDVITQKFLGFSLNRLLESRFGYINADMIEMDLSGQTVTDSYWRVSGTLQDITYKYFMEANVGYRTVTSPLSEGGNYVKSRYTEVNLGQNRLEGSVEIPAISDLTYSLEVNTDLNTKDNAKNRLNAIVDGVLSLYYKDEIAFLDATGFTEWLNGAIDTTAFNLPKAYLDGVDLSKLIVAEYNTLSKALLLMIRDKDTSETDEELYQKLLENFYSEGNTVYFKVTEEIIMALREDDRTLMSITAEILGMEEKQLETYLGKDFFSSAELILGCNLDTGEIIVRFNEKGTMIFEATFVFKDYRSVYVPAECEKGGAAYAPIKYPEYATLEVNVDLNVRNGKAFADVSPVFGLTVGDVSGKNTPYTLNGYETINVVGTVTQNIIDSSIPNFVDLSLFAVSKTDRKPLLRICTNPKDYNELLVSFYTPMGDYDNPDGLFFRIPRQVLIDSLNELLGEDNVFTQTNVVTLIIAVIDMEGVSSLEKADGWFKFSLVAQGDNDPVYELIGVKDTVATVKARVNFERVNDDIADDNFIAPVVTDIDNVTVESLYGNDSAWKETVEVALNAHVFRMYIPYEENSVEVVTGKEIYNPYGEIFGIPVTYEVRILSEEGRYKIYNIGSRTLIIDPAYTNKLPEKIEVRFDNGLTGSLPCEFVGFNESNITPAGYNLAGFAGDFEKCVTTKVIIGKNSIMSAEYQIYILVNNRKVVDYVSEDGSIIVAPDNVPVVGVINIDPYTYALKLADDSSYDPIKEGIEKQNMTIRFNNVYGTEDIVTEEGAIISNELTYESEGANYRYLSDLDLTWDYDTAKISWMGNADYAYATYGSDDGTPIKIAIRIVVSAKIVDYIKIDEENNGEYTVDFLVRSTYNIPSQSDVNHDVYLYFVTGDAAIADRRKLVLERPLDITDEDYYENYVTGSLSWAGAEILRDNPNSVTVNGTANLFGNGNTTTAKFGTGLTVGIQTVNLAVNVPSRYQSARNAKGRVAANYYDEDKKAYTDISQIQISAASFKADGGMYEPYGMNPYDTAARLPSEVYLTVAKRYDTREQSFYDDNGVMSGNATVKKYAVTWLTTDQNGNELNLIERKEDGKYGLKNPVVNQQDFVVYGRIGDRGSSTPENVGYIWVVMIVRNLASELRNVRFDDIPVGELKIDIDPYVAYSLPTRFDAELENGNPIAENNINWSVSIYGSDVWYPIVYNTAAGVNYCDADGKRLYDERDRFIFPYTGGNYILRYVLEGSSEVIRQEQTILVIVPERRVATLEDFSLIDIKGGSEFKNGYRNIDAYDKSGEELYKNVQKTVNGGNISVAFSGAINSDGSRIPYNLAVDWVSAKVGSEEYEISAEKLLGLFTDRQEGVRTQLVGYIAKGTVNEQILTVEFTFEKFVVDSIEFDRIYVASLERAVEIAHYSDSRISMAVIEENGEINLIIEKPFALKDERGLYASPYQYINYLFGDIRLHFEGGVYKNTLPVLDFGEYVGREADFNRKVLGINDTAEETLTTIYIRKLSQGSALQDIAINIRVIKDERLDNSASFTAELFNEDSEELYGEAYILPTTVTVGYKNSGRVTYQVSEWIIEQRSAEYFGNIETTVGIPVSLINTLRSDAVAVTGKQPSELHFMFPLPCEDRNFNITVHIPKKDIGLTGYTALSEDGLFRITNGLFEVTNPYLYYSEDSEYGMDVTKIPTVIDAIVSSKYENTEVNCHYVSWNFVKRADGTKVFDSSRFSQGIEKELFATATLPAYYGPDGRKQTQTVELYISVAKLEYSGISYGEMPVKADANGNMTVITVDPYDDVMGYKGNIDLPTENLTVLFNNGEDYYVFGSPENPVTYSLLDAEGRVLIGSITDIPYDEKGHTLPYEAIKYDRILRLRANILGFANGVTVYVNIESRIIEDVIIDNYIFTDGKIDGKKELRGVYYIDPYNTATFALPNEIQVKFEDGEDYTVQNVTAWELFDGEYAGYLSDGSNKSLNWIREYGEGSNWLNLDDTKDFYARSEGEVSYGFYKLSGKSFEGKNYIMRGYISLGRTFAGVAGRQDFYVNVIVLNRSLKTEYSAYYRFDDPLGGVLSDIPSSLTEEMFVEYDKFYSEIGLPESYRYSAWTAPVVPYVNWNTKNDESIIDYHGNFDKNIEGNAYYGNANRGFLYRTLGDEVKKQFALLVDSRMWDGYFTSGGVPQVVYTGQTAVRLAELKEELEREVLYATYQKVLRAYNAGTEQERQYANYMYNVLVNEIIAEYNYDRIREFEFIVEKMFERVRKAYENGENTADSLIYAYWKSVYDVFVADNNEYDANLSDYRKLKAEKFAAAESLFTVMPDYNKTLRARIESSLRIYIDGAIWDRMYNRSSMAERNVMDGLLKGSTDELSKSNALNTYLNYESRQLGSIGETAYAHITAPYFALGNMIESVNGDTVVYKTEFLFNIYSSLSFIDKVEVETVINYSSVFEKYIEEGLRLAIEDLRELYKGESLEEYVIRKTVEYVNSIVPYIFDTSTGEEKPVIGFEYVYGSFDDLNSATYEQRYGRFLVSYWDTLKKHLEDSAVAHVDADATDEKSWNNAYKAHFIKKEDAVCNRMNEIKKEVEEELNNGTLPVSTNKYAEMFARYTDYLKKQATAELDRFYDEAATDANVDMVEQIRVSGVALGDRYHKSAVESFQIMFEEYGDIIYQKACIRFPSATEKGGEIDSAFYSAIGGNGSSGARTVHFLMTDTKVSNAIKGFVTNLFYSMLGGYKAYDVFMNNYASLDLDDEYVERLIAMARGELGALEKSIFNDSLTDEEYENYANYVVVNNLYEYYRGRGDNRANTVKAWIDEAIRVEYAKGFERLCVDSVKNGKLQPDALLTLRDNSRLVKKHAFEKLVLFYEQKGKDIATEITNGRDDRINGFILEESERIVTELIAENFAYSYYLRPDTAEKPTLQAQALQYYKDNFATPSERTAIGYYVSLYGNNAYDQITVRGDFGAESVEKLNSTYYYILLQSMLSKVKEEILSDEVAYADRNSQEYKDIQDEVMRIFRAVSLNQDATDKQISQITVVVDRLYKTEKYTVAIRNYTDKISAMRVSSEFDLKAKNALYDYMYLKDSALFDEIIRTYEPDETVAYGYLSDLLKRDEGSYFYDAVAEIAENTASENLFDTIGVYNLSNNSAEGEANKFYNKIYNLYIGFEEAEKIAVRQVVGDAFTSSDSYINRSLAILNAFEKLRSSQTSALNELAEEILASVIRFFYYTDEGEKNISEGIKNSVGEKLYEEKDADYISVVAFTSYLTLLQALTEGRKSIPTEYLTEENIAGRYSETLPEFKREYVKILMEVLERESLIGARSYLDMAFKAELEKANEAIFAEIEDGTFAVYGELILQKMRLTAAHGDLGEGETAEILANYLTVKNGIIDSLLRDFGSFEAMKKDNSSTMFFKPEDQADGEEDYRHIIMFEKGVWDDKTELLLKAPVYIGNKAKIEESLTNAHKIDSIDYRYVPVEIKYVDFTDTVELGNVKENIPKLNLLSVDPLAPVLPTQAHAFGEFVRQGGENVLYDIGYVDIDYGATFDYNVFEGMEAETGSYSLSFVDVKGTKFDNFLVTVEYKNRTVKNIYLDTDVYGGNRVANIQSQFSGKYLMNNGESNVLTVDPTRTNILDVHNRQYILPSEVTVEFVDGTVLSLRDVTYYMANIPYTLSGRKNIPLRIAGYSCDTADGMTRTVSFDYVTNKMTVAVSDGENVNTRSFKSVPTDTIWNTKLDITDRTVTEVWIRDEKTNEERLLGKKSDKNSDIIVPKENYKINPFDVIFPSDYYVKFGEIGSEYVVDGNWKPESGANGTNKIIDIIMGNAQDKNISTEFTYYGYTVTVKFVADDIELEGLQTGEFYDGGTLYLVVGAGSITEQLERNYSTLYYNFSNDYTQPDYRKVPLSFIPANVNSITTEIPNTTRGVKGVLGWDKRTYPSMNLSPNIEFTIVVLDPQLYATLEGETNPYAVTDLISMPHDENMRKINDPNEPNIAEYFVKINDNGEELRFPINKDSIKYDLLNGVVSYECEFTMLSSFRRLVADEKGGRTMNFTVSVTFESYLYTDLSDVAFDRTPVKNAKGEDMWKWTDLPETSALYRDGIIWELGEPMKASYLPKVICENGEAVSLLWDLTDINVNLSTVDSARGYYIARGYYYGSEKTWEFLELAIYVRKHDATEQIVEALGGNLSLYSEYNGHYYKLPLDANAPEMLMLRRDGSYAALAEEAITVEYKIFSEEDRKYSATAYPLDAGEYAVRVTINDENVTAEELVFKLVIRPVNIVASNLVFEREENNTVIYTYDGKPKGLTVVSGLPSVLVDNWFGSVDEKNAIFAKHNASLAERDDLTAEQKTQLAKSMAYMELYSRVTPATARYLDNLKRTISETEGVTDTYELNAVVFDRLTANLSIVEVITDVQYYHNGELLDTVPINVGTYTARFTISALDKNHTLGGTVANKVIVIEQPDVRYTLAETKLVYNGQLQNPRISGLHDENGRLPEGVTVEYVYKSGVAQDEKYYYGGVMNAGTYTYEIVIHGGNNYPDGAIMTGRPLEIVARDLFIDLRKGESAYLAPIENVSNKAEFRGLIGFDLPSMFGIADIYTDAKDYFVPDTYGIYLNGFRIRIGEPLYTVIDDSSVTEIDGVSYYRLYLKPVNAEGSLYNGENKTLYADIISMIGTKEAPGNYAVYVMAQGKYEITVNADGDETVYTVTNDEELNEVLASIKEREKVRIYLSAMRDEEDNLVRTEYSSIILNVNAGITIIGCYDKDKNIVTSVKNIVINEGSVTVRILEFTAQEAGDVALLIGREVGSVNVYDCLFDGSKLPLTVGIRTEAGFSDKVYVDNTRFIGYGRGILLLGGNLEAVSCVFFDNTTAVSLESDGTDIRVSSSQFSGNGTGIFLGEMGIANILNNFFETNSTAINAPGRERITLFVQNEFAETNINDVVV